MEARYAIILAAGKGTRMKSKLYKVLHPVSGKPMVEHIINRVSETNPDEIITIVGHGAEQVKAQLGERSEYALQAEQLGTGHAVLQAASFLEGKKGTTLVISGDTPLLTTETLNNLFEYHQGKNASATILTAQAQNPTGYGRIIRDHVGIVEKIVEQKDASPEEARVKEINTGTYCFDNEALFTALNKVGTNNAQGEYYLTDIIEILKEDGNTVAAYQTENFEESMGVNDRIALAKANEIMRKRINEAHMTNGVTFVDPASTYIDAGVVIGSDTVIEAGVQLQGETVIGMDCMIGAHSRIVDSVIEDNVVITNSVIESSHVKKAADVGPFAHLRPNAEIGEGVHIGNFVEVKNAEIGNHTKVGHLTYVGDATLGEDINVGCGVVFVNYDGKQKHHTKVGAHSFIGSNSNIVAPVTIEDHSSIAAGSTITNDVPEYALAIARARQVNKEGYAKKLPYLN
ncbi:bifunctional UDP-N-acetylglucosamine diphosphorylase/glucosamine-1-phosphate N-acetyltransferase GlmU [Enterococcus thailandicus]|uniref:bifunctional UDP-N-acetylglucosamine diphosphorylase/glucosamine-1-phosphate N-acetyltransferase GlmU n=1 Tax=Enterococcus thailandicus TaxID=417368 RepID=UPI0022EBC533|nr:bifunctional UDP-N-acetylglucosamine diphosphorylase/glucosamine-1-phosphate N-acetyltransferase GlmU [Enterococcus thailandicus]MDA3974662.1 bifunctional UDP-N-acetylglucosamine diphosphorylase/glucosamine-1-phosphate N-acetyltransferase GlmU [Enterococcus thailandicus]MDA3977148.1 bifunctional UDP-N-acetylglucosamine diphosphorylase/glucosamine-1-phosphate N-acetyltransferase GlmU [Enterococcus thailandicus]MDA3982070.1 bifunctional UDP-N-acetylglucosamine diphosphorylase/glucosamine-1-phos